MTVMSVMGPRVRLQWQHMAHDDTRRIMIRYGIHGHQVSHLAKDLGVLHPSCRFPRWGSLMQTSPYWALLPPRPKTSRQKVIETSKVCLDNSMMRNCLIELLSLCSSLNALIVLPAFTPEVIMLSKRGLSMVWTLLFPEALLSTLPLLSPNQIVSETWKVQVCLFKSFFWIHDSLIWFCTSLRSDKSKSMELASPSCEDFSCYPRTTLSCKSRYFSWPHISLLPDSQQPMLELHSTTCSHLVSEQHGEDGCLDGLAGWAFKAQHLENRKPEMLGRTPSLLACACSTCGQKSQLHGYTAKAKPNTAEPGCIDQWFTCEAALLVQEFSSVCNFMNEAFHDQKRGTHSKHLLLARFISEQHLPQCSQRSWQVAGQSHQQLSHQFEMHLNPSWRQTQIIYGTNASEIKSTAECHRHNLNMAVADSHRVRI